MVSQRTQEPLGAFFEKYENACSKERESTILVRIQFLKKTKFETFIKICVLFLFEFMLFFAIYKYKLFPVFSNIFQKAD